MVRWLAVVTLLMGMALSAAGAGANPATPPAVSSPAACPVTFPNNDRPPGHNADGGYGNDWLWTNLYMWSDGPEVIVPDDGRISPDGAINGMKWAWRRYVPGKLTVEGRRLDAPSAPLEAWVPDGYGDIGFQVTGLTFPSAGCWEITGTLNGHTLTFVTLVIVPDSAATPTPVS
jgi:hypothetical protein